MQTLEQEKFDTVRELSELGIAIAEGRAVLEKLKSDTDTYVAEREEKAIQKVAQVLEESRDALAEVAKNHEELTSYLRAARDYAGSLARLHESLQQLKATLLSATEALEERIERHRIEVDRVRLETRRQFTLLAGERAALASDKIRRDEEWRKIADKAQTLERTAARLKQNRL
jgi:uncharacterized phage infection (PIP) family protein YhgE